MTPGLDRGILEQIRCASARFEHLLAGTAVALALALTPYASSAFAASEAAITAAVPMPESADLPPPSIKDIAPAEPPAVRRPPNAPQPAPARDRASPVRVPASDGAKFTTAAAGDTAHRRQASRPTDRRKIRPHPRRQEGARRPSKRSTRAATSRRSGSPTARISERAKAAAAYLAGVEADGLDPSDYPVPQIKAGIEPDALAEAEIKFTDSVLTFARHAMTGRVHYSRVAADILYDLAKPDPAERAGPARQCAGRRRSARQLQSAAAAATRR